MQGVGIYCACTDVPRNSSDCSFTLVRRRHRIAQIMSGLRCELSCSFVMDRDCCESSCNLLNVSGDTYSLEVAYMTLR
jgi:hypothetical protein